MKQRLFLHRIRPRRRAWREHPMSVRRLPIQLAIARQRLGDPVDRIGHLAGGRVFRRREMRLSSQIKRHLPAIIELVEELLTGERVEGLGSFAAHGNFSSFRRTKREHDGLVSCQYTISQSKLFTGACELVCISTQLIVSRAKSTILSSSVWCR